MGGPEGPSSYTRRPPSSTNILYFQKYALAAPVEDDPIVNPQEAGEGVSRFREAVLCDITAGFSKRYRRGAEGNTSPVQLGDTAIFVPPLVDPLLGPCEWRGCLVVG